jgi:hypothetical protein
MEVKQIHSPSNFTVISSNRNSTLLQSQKKQSVLMQKPEEEKLVEIKNKYQSSMSLSNTQMPTRSKLAKYSLEAMALSPYVKDLITPRVGPALKRFFSKEEIHRLRETKRG